MIIFALTVGWLYRQYPSSYPISKCGYFSMWPAASPYVTTVGKHLDRSIKWDLIMNISTGGTRFSSATSEIVDSSDAGGYITSGGGFSFMNKAPSFQSAAISSYFSHDTPRQTKTQRYSSTNRGYPDLSLLAESFRKLSLIKATTSLSCRLLPRRSPYALNVHEICLL